MMIGSSLGTTCRRLALVGCQTGKLNWMRSAAFAAIARAAAQLCFAYLARNNGGVLSVDAIKSLVA